MFEIPVLEQSIKKNCIKSFLLSHFFKDDWKSLNVT